MIIQSRNLLTENAPKTFLSSGVAVSGTTYPVRNTTGFTTSWAVQIGETGHEQTEVVVGTVTNAGTITGVACNYAHPADAPIYGIKFNQVVFERSITGTVGTASPMTSGTVSYAADSFVTQFDDTSGSSTYAYRTYFRNPILGVNSIESDWITSAGFSFYSLGKLRERVKEKLWSSTYLSDPMVDNWINEWKDELVTAAISTNEDYSMGTVDIGFGTAGLGTVTTADFNQIRRFEVTYNGSDFYLSTRKTVNDFLPNQTFSSVHPYHNWVGDTIFQVRPAENGGTARISFYRFGTTMVNDTDELPLPLRPYTKSFIDYVLAQAYLKDNKRDFFGDMMGVANAAKAVFANQLSPRDKSGPQVIDLVEMISSEDEFWP